MADQTEKVKVLILSRDADWCVMANAALKRNGVDVVDVVTEAAVIPFGELSARYNILVVDKPFMGNARDTATLVRLIRREFFDPMIGMELYSDAGELLSLRVAGCNFYVRLGLPGMGIHKLARTIDQISHELQEPQRD